MSPCTPLQSSVIIPGPSSGISGFAPQTPSLQFPFPTLPFEDLGGIFDSLSLILPSGTLRPELSANFSRDILDGVSSLLSKFAPFLSMYTFFLPVLNLILCIIEVICSIPNPFKLIRAVIRLFRNCIPEFLALFPMFALPIMILSLLLLILTLIIYLLERILTIIQLIIDNINTLGKASARLDNDSIIAITRKIGDLICLLQNLFVVLGGIILIIQVIESIIKLSFKIPPCDDGDSSNDGCCTPDICPSFLKNNNTITGSSGFLQYFNEVGKDSGLSLPPGFPPISSALRNESWQFYDPNLTGYSQFNNITHAVDLPAGTTKIFFPTTKTFTATTPSDQAPYTVDLRLFYNPTSFGRVDILGPRYLRVNGCVVTSPPVDGVSDYENNLQSPTNGTLFLAGGMAYEDDNQTVMKINPSDTSPATLNTLVHTDAVISSSPSLSPTDGYLFQDITYTFNINHSILLGDGLITTGCVPEVNQNKNIINNALNLPDLTGIILPDVNAAKECVINALTTFRQSVSIDSANKLQEDITNCLNILKNDTSAAAIQAILAAYSQYKSYCVVDPTIQFTTYPIKVSVHLNDQNGNSIINNLPADIASALIPKLKADINFGNISPFTYDGYGLFIADITSNVPGNGTIQMSFDNKYFSTFVNPSDITQLPSVSINKVPYTFVLAGPMKDIARRDEGDVSRANSDGSG